MAPTTATGPESEPPREDTVETTFGLLADAKKLESESSYWLATEKFVEAHRLLRVLAGEAHETASTVGSAEDAQRIAELYESKADEYWKHSRSCLIRAMEHETTLDDEQPPPEEDQDSSNNNNTTEIHGSRDRPKGIASRACTLLDDDRARARNHSFSVLFSRPIVEEPPAQQPPATVTEDPTGGAVANEVDLEARLRALNQSLPSAVKTVDERMSDIHSGLNKMGLSLYTQKQSPFARFEDELPKSEDEQIDEIMAQARDEAMVDGMNRGDGAACLQPTQTTTGGGKGDDDDLEDSESDDDDDDSEEDALLDNDQLAMKTIQKKVVRAQVKLAELLALVDQARKKRAKEDQEEEEEIYRNNGAEDTDDEEDSFREVQKHDVAFLMMNGKKKLKSAQRDMKKALAEWEDLIL